MAICELPGMLRTSRELSCIEKKTLMSSKILTHNPAVFLCPTDLFAKHCHIKWWCFGKEHCKHTLARPARAEMGLPV